VGNEAVTIRLSELQRRPPPVDGQKWGPWVYRAHNLTLEWKGNPDQYYIDLESCTDASHVLDWLLQISHKGWASARDVGELLRALDELAGDLQGEVCPWGQNESFSYAARLTEG
jgi:hypothetical protein